MKRAEQDLNFIAEVLPAFLSEAQEQLEAMEQILLRLEEAPRDKELLDALFRCAHTVKGSAGIFGLEEIVAFTHHVETLLDQLREGRFEFTPDLGTLLLQCNDQIRLLVEAAADPAAVDPAAVRQREQLVQLLRTHGAAPSVAAPADAPAGAAPPQGLPHWFVTAQFGSECFRNGMDPMAVLNYVGGLGTVPRMVCDQTAVPPLQSLDPEACYLSVGFELDTQATRGEIENGFSFVRDDCALQIIEPTRYAERCIALIESMPDNPRLGDILVAVGAVTPGQLQQALRVQHQAPAGKTPRPLGDILHNKAGIDPQVIDAALQKQSRSREGTAARTPADDKRLIRVQADRLDAVINLLGELVIAGAGASLLARQSRNGALIEANAQIGRLIEEIRNGTLQLRMVPISETFTRFRRVVRDTAAELGKEVALQIEGGETELDKSMVERIADPLMHLVRNALDHGLEPPQERLAAGKPAQGTLTLSACHEAGGIIIRIIDDGRGVLRRKVLARAWERGLLERDVIPDDEDILRLIFEPGFSTAEQITNLSGRGVGMDVVRRNVEALRGSVTMHSIEGAGSTIEIRLPLTLAIIDGFLVAVGNSKFIFPLESVVEVIESRPDISRSDARGRHCVELRGRALPVLDLRAAYGLEGVDTERQSVVVVQNEGRQYGVIVDTLLGQHQTVIKPLGRMLRSLRGISGSSILGNGEVALIFDVYSLGAMAAAEPVRRVRSEAGAGAARTGNLQRETP